MSGEEELVNTEVLPAEVYKNEANEYFKRMKNSCFNQ